MKFPSFIDLKIIKFGIVGASGALLGLGVLYFFTSVIGLYYMVSYLFAFLVSLTSNYFLNSYWTFKSKPYFNGWLKYGGASIFTMLLNGGILWVLTDMFGIWYIISSICGTFIAFLANFALGKKYVWETA